MEPLVSVICLCFNHKLYIEECVQSVIDQTYANVEIIIVDDCSTDGSQEVIKQIERNNKGIQTLLLDSNLGNCRAFNQGLKLASGDYIIDLATDDVLLPERIAAGIETMDALDDSYGVNFCNASMISGNGETQRTLYRVDALDKALDAIPQGDIYEQLIKRYFISSPTMLIRKEVFNELDGYDESLAYEDFDFWIRSSRRFKYAYTDKILFKRRDTPGSLSKQQYKRSSGQMESTFKVCQKIKELNRVESENKALKQRIKLEMKQCIKYTNFKLLSKYWKLLRTV